MRWIVGVLAMAGLFTSTLPARGACPDSGCLGGGGPTPADCAVQWDGIDAEQTSCVDGSACDLDNTADGTCTFGLRACVGFASATCEATALTSPAKVGPKKDPAAQALATALAGFSGGTVAGCTNPGFAVPIQVSAKSLTSKTVKLKMSVKSAAGKDVDKLTLTCLPATPSLSAHVQPILTASCATAGCHRGASPSQGLNLEDGQSHGEMVGKGSTLLSKLSIVEAGNLKRSFMGRKLTGEALGATGGSKMPQGCPGIVPCLTDGETYLILAWIAAGAPND